MTVISHENPCFKGLLDTNFVCGRAQYVLKWVSFESKDCTKELKLECAYFLGQTS